MGFAASTLTHPVVWFAFPRLQLSAWPGALALAGWTGLSARLVPYAEMVLLAEVFAVAVEAGFTGALGLRRSLLWSLAANGASFGLALLSRQLFPGPWTP